jgi:hypothetical protein
MEGEFVRSKSFDTVCGLFAPVVVEFFTCVSEIVVF